MGSTEDLEEIINHPWFEDIEWDKLKNKKLTAPYIPVFDDEESTQYFDEGFTA